MSKKTRLELQDFLSKAEQFKLGHLKTEQAHPKTQNLSELSQTDLKTAIKILKEIDIDMLNILKNNVSSIMMLRHEIKKVLAQNGRIFLSGCGATGRLSLSIENLWRTIKRTKKDYVISFMAGGDVALVKSIENSEDHPEYADRQLHELGFKDGDLLIASSEGGETPYVIGAIQSALKLSTINPFFLYCNPDDLLLKNIERSKKIIENNCVTKINLSTGPMVISGSTRMQASTIIMAVIGYALLFDTPIHEHVKNLSDIYKKIDLNFLCNFIKKEADIYNNNDFVIYLTKRYPLTILTDTTERSPTFNLNPFENIYDANIKPSLSYLCIPNKFKTEAAWLEILKRKPRTLNWKEYNNVADIKYLNGFNFSKKALKLKQKLVAPFKLFTFEIDKKYKKIFFILKDYKHEINIDRIDILTENLILKMILNIHSTLLMGILKRYNGNIMTWVKPTNYKLIDRAIRYIMLILNRKNIYKYSYKEVAKELFIELECYTEKESIIDKVANKMSKGF